MHRRHCCTRAGRPGLRSGFLQQAEPGAPPGAGGGWMPSLHPATPQLLRRPQVLPTALKHVSPPRQRRYVRLWMFISSNSCALQPRAAPAPALSRRSSAAATKQGRICSDPHSHSARRCKTHQQHLPPAR